MNQSTPASSPDALPAIVRWGSLVTAFVLPQISGCKPDPVPDTPKPPAISPPTATTSAPAPVVSTAPPPPDAAPPTVACTASESRAAFKRLARNKAGEPRIVGGRPSSFPWVVALTTDGSAAGQYCGGSLIKPDVVLTAAHCQVRASEKVIVGRTDLKDATKGKVVGITQVRNHAAYDQDSHDNDVAVVKLAEAVEIEPLALYSGPDGSGQPSLVIGWGHVQEGGPPSSKLLEVEVPIVANDVCSAGYAPDNVGITSNMLCAGLAQGGKDSCQGDSGGPLVVMGEGGKWRQAGVVSFGIGCARPNKYGVYARVSKYVPWIEACAK
jgi:secreted trypsin-like serine protease